MDLVDGWDVEEQEWASILTTKGETEEEMYTGMLEHIRKNPINQKPLVKGFNSTMRHFLMGKL
jgi:hypothetical protein